MTSGATLPDRTGPVTSQDALTRSPAAQAPGVSVRSVRTSSSSKIGISVRQHRHDSPGKILQGSSTWSRVGRLWRLLKPNFGAKDTNTFTFHDICATA